ncbi:MAG: S-adenosylmethionine synthetase N-terminal domain-containing protein, partial [Candidatus Levybacteria bacterium]|nr:S-adenosylmethionine synthetase N-terminal domain-containing protein [Candidatus Levybacteria bacterium]
MHPDKICDRISDAILDEALRQDPDSRVAIETMGGHGIITITGEMTTKAFVDVKEVVKGIVGDKYGVQSNIVRQSAEIAQGVDRGGAGDQGIMVGYACDETPEKMPLEV